MTLLYRISAPKSGFSPETAKVPQDTPRSDFEALQL
jgi:hypothetical protein